MILLLLEQGGYSLPTYSTRTRAVPPGVCPSPRASAIFLTAITVAWSDGNDGGSSITAFVVRFSGGEETDEVRNAYNDKYHIRRLGVSV